jgi:hypothetical protein
MKSIKKWLNAAWKSTALRNLGNVIVSVALSTVLASHGVPVQDAAAIGQAGGAVILGQ